MEYQRERILSGNREQAVSAVDVVAAADVVEATRPPMPLRSQPPRRERRLLTLRKAYRAGGKWKPPK
jgi:hypothetical protein